MNGQIQYGSARPLTLEPTVAAGAPRTADPDRFPALTRTGRPVVLLFGTCLLLGALLTAAPREVPGVAVAIVLGGAWLSLVLAMTLPPPSERAGQELVRRLAQFRHEMIAIGDTPSRVVLERMIARASELDLREDEIAEELEQLRACIDAIDLKEQLAGGTLPIAEAADDLPAGETCHFACPVRSGRRRSDQLGHLLLTRQSLKFRGAVDLNVGWHEVASVARDGRDIVVAVHDSRRVLRFTCTSFSEAALGGVVAEHFTQLAQAAQPADTPYQPSL